MALALAAAPAAAAAEGLELVPELEILVFLLILFAVIVIPVNRLIFRPILAVLDAREAQISGVRERGVALAAESDRLLARHDDALREVRAEAADERKQLVEAARSRSASRLAEARRGAEAEIERARAELGTAVAAARDTLRQQAEGLAQEAASRVLGRPLS